MIDGLEYRGTSFFQCYTSCQPEHGVGDNMSANQARMVRDSRGMPEFIYNWKDHYRSWKKFIVVPSLFLKYEDLLNDIEMEINKIINFFYTNFQIDISNKNEKINNIIKSTNFIDLKNLENKYGFFEKSEFSDFFRSGKKNQWSDKLNKSQQIILEKNFEKEMIQLKYI